MYLDLMNNYRNIWSISSLSQHRIRNILFDILYNIYFHVKHNSIHILYIKYRNYIQDNLMNKEDIEYYLSSIRLHNTLNINKQQMNYIFYNYQHIVHKFCQKAKYILLYMLDTQYFRYKLNNFMDILYILYFLNNNHLDIQCKYLKSQDNQYKINFRIFYIVHLLK